MKTVAAPIALLIFLGLTSVSFAKDCQKSSLELVEKLESVLADLNGFAQGDFEAFEATSKVMRSSNDSVTIKVSVGHTNEDHEDWSQDYEVILQKGTCAIKAYRFLGFNQ